MKRYSTRFFLIPFFLLTMLFFFASVKLAAQTAINYGNCVQGSISAAAEIDIYVFTGSPSEKIRILASQYSSQTFFVLTVEIRKPNGSLLKRIQNSNVQFDTTLLDAGSYTIWISDDNGLEGSSYGIGLHRLISQMGTTLQYGENRQSGIGAAAELDSYLFIGHTGDKIRILASHYSSQTFFLLTVEIYKPDGSLFKRIQNSSVQFDTTLADIGTYTIWISDNNALEGSSYGLGLYRLVSQMGTTVQYGENKQSGIGGAAELESYLFTGGLDEKIRIISAQYSSQTFFTLTIEIYKPDGSLLKKIQSGNVQFDTTLLDAGTYTIWVMDNNGLEGSSYGLGLYRLIPPINPNFCFGENRQAGIGAAAELDSYVFNAVANDAIRLVASQYSSQTFFLLTIEIYKPDGTLLKKLQGTNISFDTSLFESGKYTIWVLDDNWLEGSNYGLAIYRFNSGPACNLPVDWLYFKSQSQGKDVQLTWATTSEQNSKEFIIERSADGGNFTAIGTVSAAGNSSQTNAYRFTDLNAMRLSSPKVHYRLKQIDLDGTFAYSSTISIGIKQVALDALIYAYPNPFTQTISLQLSEPALGAMDNLALYSSEGRLVYQRKLSANSGTTVLLSDLPQLSKGVYFLRVTVNGNATLLKLTQSQ